MASYETDSEPESVMFMDDHFLNDDFFNFEELDPELHTALIESFEMEQPVCDLETEFKLNVSPIKVPKTVSSKTVFCSGCLVSYPEHEMHLFQDCLHGLCKHECALRYTLPYCPECKICICQRNEDSSSEQKDELYQLVDSCITLFLKDHEMQTEGKGTKRMCEFEDFANPKK